MNRNTERNLANSKHLATINWCGHCAARVPMVTVDQAAALTQTDWETIYWGVQSKQMHYAETPEGMLLICLKQFGKGH